ncbi:prolyl oligopeptidase family serine peptidase [Planctomycetes bacterium CA13]
MCSNSAADEPKKEVQTNGRFTRTIEVKQDLKYLLFLPKDYDPERAEGWPMILFLHGAGERGNDLSRVKVHGPPKQAETDRDFPFVLVSPQCPEGKTWDVSELNGLLDQAITEHNIDTNRIYLTGLSMGGYGTWSLGIANPERFAAIVPICGGGERLSILLADEAKKVILMKLPVWAFHGGKDPVVPMEETERMIDALERMGTKNAKLTIHPDAGHDSWTQTYEDPEFYPWLLKQTRSR